MLSLISYRKKAAGVRFRPYHYHLYMIGSSPATTRHLTWGRPAMPSDPITFVSQSTLVEASLNADGSYGNLWRQKPRLHFHTQLIKQFLVSRQTSQDLLRNWLDLARNWCESNLRKEMQSYISNLSLIYSLPPWEPARHPQQCAFLLVQTKHQVLRLDHPAPPAGN